MCLKNQFHIFRHTLNRWKNSRENRRENSSEYGDVKAFVKGIRGVDQYASWCTEKADLSVLWNATGR